MNKRIYTTGRALVIEDFSLQPNLITVQWHTPRMDTNTETELCRTCFEQWLADSGRLQWVSDSTDNEGEHLQHKGTMNTENYWLYASLEEKSDDLKAFILAEVAAQQELS